MSSDASVIREAAAAFRRLGSAESILLERQAQTYAELTTSAARARAEASASGEPSRKAALEDVAARYVVARDAMGRHVASRLLRRHGTEAWPAELSELTLAALTRIAPKEIAA